jgi:hypothetical protein
MRDHAALLYERQGMIHIAAESTTVEGQWIVTPPFLVLPSTAPADEVAGAVLDALAGSRMGIEPPDEQDEEDVVAIRAFTQFMSGASAIWITSDGETIRLTPLHNAGGGKGFEIRRQLATDVPATRAGVAGALPAALAAAS